jgi:tetratricopeptide (TPR) repeat protein
MKQPKSICFLLALCLGGMALQAIQTVAAKDSWISVRSKNFTLIGNADEKDIRKVAAQLEQFREAVSRLFDQPKRKFTPPITVVVFRDDESYTPFKPLYQGRPSEVSGYFQSSNGAIYITLTADWRASNPYAIIFHEYVHFLTNDAFAPLPTWLSEGLAEYYSSFEATKGGRKITVGKSIPSRIRLLREGKLFPLAALLAVNHDSPLYNDADKKSIFYAQSWALVHYLMAGNNGSRQPQLRQFIASLAQGQSAETAEELFKRAFHTSLAGFELELMNYIRRNNYPSQQVTFEQKIEFDQAMQTAQLSEAGTAAHLGDLYWHLGRHEESETLLQRALALDSGIVSAHSSLGLLRMRQQRYGEARRHLGRAIEANSTNHLVHYNYALAWQQEQVDSLGYVSHFPPEVAAGMRASLNRARELAPEFADTYKTLAFINLVQRENLEEAEALLKRALELEPNRDDFAYTLAQVYLRRQNFTAARQTAEKIVGAGERTDIRNRANFLIKVIAQREEDLARVKAEEEARRQQQQATLNEKRDDPTKPPGRRFEGEQVRGLLTRIECGDNFMVLTVISGVRAFRFRSERGQPTFVRHTPEIPLQITCGAMVPARQVIVTYRIGGNARLKVDGEPVGVEFLKTGAD